MLLLIIILNLSLALTFTLSKYVINAVDPLWFLAIRMLVGGTFFSIWYGISQEKKVKLTALYTATLFILAFLNVYLTNICQLWALKTLSAAKACLIYNFNPFIIMLLGYFFLHESISRRKIMALTFGWCGLVVALIQNNNHGLDYVISLGEIAILIAAITTAISSVILQKIVRNDPYPVSLTTGVPMLLGGSLSLLHGIFSSCPIPHSIAPSIIVAGIVVTSATIICAGLYAYLIKFYPASFISFTGFTAPLCAAGFDWLIFGATPSPYFYGAMFLVSLGLYIFHRDTQQEKSTRTL